MRKFSILLMPLVLSCATTGSKGEASIDAEQQAAMTRMGQQVKGLIVWSSSRQGNHDLFCMNTDGSERRALTKSDHVDWFSRFSPDGKRVLFTRSKKGWVYERDANRNNKWDIFTVPVAGGEPSRVVENASWGTWTGDNEILFSRASKVFTKNLASGDEVLLLDSETDAALKGADLQQPQLSPDGRHLAITLRGAMRATGIYNLETKSWHKTGEGCQVNWHPSGQHIYWVNPSGNGGSEVFSVPVHNGVPTKEHSYEEMRFIDIPGRQSHEYFPQMSADAKVLVWAATARGHDHDIADYDIFVWETGTPAEQATRFTFHSGNDRWPDLHLFDGPSTADPANADPTTADPSTADSPAAEQPTSSPAQP